MHGRFLENFKKIKENQVGNLQKDVKSSTSSNQGTTNSGPYETYFSRKLPLNKLVPLLYFIQSYMWIIDWDMMSLYFCSAHIGQ